MKCQLSMCTAPSLCWSLDTLFSLGKTPLEPRDVRNSVINAIMKTKKKKEEKKKSCCLQQGEDNDGRADRGAEGCIVRWLRSETGLSFEPPPPPPSPLNSEPFSKQQLWNKSRFTAILSFLYLSVNRGFYRTMAQFSLFCLRRRGGLRVSYQSARVIHLQVIKKKNLIFWKRFVCSGGKAPRRRGRCVVNKGSYVSNAINRGHLKTLHDCRHLII